MSKEQNSMVVSVIFATTFQFADHDRVDTAIFNKCFIEPSTVNTLPSQAIARFASFICVLVFSKSIK